MITMALDTKREKKKPVAIIGSGLIGRSFAMLYAASGYPVRLYDIEASQIDDALRDIHDQLVHLDKTNFLRGNLSVTEQEKLISGTNNLADCVKGAFFIQECVPERLAIKQQVHSEIDSLMDKDAILSSSSSAIIPSAISEKLKNKNRFVVVHPTNPPFYAPLIELVPASWTDPDALDFTRQLMMEIGQVPVVLKREIDGFVLNRIQYAILRECWSLVRNDVMSAEDIDKVMSEGLGRRYAFIGPFETIHLNSEGIQSCCERYGDTIYRVQCTFSKPEKMEGDVLEVVHTDMVNRVPLHQLSERRQWRDSRLAALDKLKRDMDQK